MHQTTEGARLSPANRSGWMHWGPYLSERQWGTVREDYSAGGTAWDSFPHDHARSRAYRWGEDGIGGISDARQRLCFALALWNGRDPILKERLFGLTNSEGNHGEDVKEVYHYLDATPSHSWLKMRYRYPHRAFPYSDLVSENARRKSQDPGAPEYELIDTGAFEDSRYFDVVITYAKRSETDLLVRITATNRGPDTMPLWLLPTLWFRNTWSWTYGTAKPHMRLIESGLATAVHPDMPKYRFVCPDAEEMLFCENETNSRKLYDQPGPDYPKDAFHDRIIGGASSTNPENVGTKAAAVYRLTLAAGETTTITLRLTDEPDARDLGPNADRVFRDRETEADAFYSSSFPRVSDRDDLKITRQAMAGMIWSKQYFGYTVARWLDGDDFPPPQERHGGRNARWRHFHAEDIVSMPDCWEYPWFASWDLCFQAVVLARVDAQFAKDQILLLMREWYMHPDGQIPAYEWAFDDVNPPLQAWAALRIVAHEADKTGEVDFDFLSSVFDHALLYFTWWVNRKDAADNNLFQGGFLGLDNISPFDRSGALPENARLYQSDGTAWVGFFALQMMEMARILGAKSPDKLEFATKFLQHFAFIADAMEHISRETNGSANLWDEEAGLFFDVMEVEGGFHPLRVRSLVSLMPIIAAAELDLATLARGEGPTWEDRLSAFRKDKAAVFERIASPAGRDDGTSLVSFLSADQLRHMLGPMLSEAEFLSDYGVRSISKLHEASPFEIEIGGSRFEVGYQPAESRSGMFGGNSNWRGPIWLPMNHLIIDALRVYDDHYGAEFKVECPTGSGRFMCLGEVADELSRRLISIFQPGPDGRRACLGSRHPSEPPEWAEDPLFYEYFHGDTGAGLGAAHQTGWTGLVAALIEEQADRRASSGAATQAHATPQAWDRDAEDDSASPGTAA